MMSTMSKPKQIKRARKQLVKALEKHAEIVSADAVPMKKAQRAAARLAEAATEYARAVEQKTGLGNPFTSGGGGLDESTLRSLSAERDELAKIRTGGIPVLEERPLVLNATGDGEAPEGTPGAPGQPEPPAAPEAPTPPEGPATPAPPSQAPPPADDPVEGDPVRPV